MKCTECGRPLHPMHTECDFCGAASPLGRPNGLEQAVERTRAAATGVLTQARGLRVALPRPSRPSGRPRVTVPRVPSLGRPSGAILVVIGGAALVALFALILVTQPSGASETELAAAQSSAAASVAKQAELQAALDATQQRLKDLEAAQGRTQAEVEARATAAETEAKSLREQVTTAAAETKAAKEATARAEQRVQSLSECLTGTTVAMQFARANSWGPADRALAAVSAACSDARAPR